MKKITLLLLAFILVTACNNNLDDELILTPSEVSFTNGGIQFTKVTNSQFDNGDEILVKALTNNSVYKQTNYTYSNSKFTSTSPIEITEGQQFAYHAIYPSSASFYGTHQIFEDQSIAENYEQSDLLVAKVDETDASSPELKFNHVMSSIILNIKVLNDGAEVNDATLDVAFNLKTAADISVNSESYTSLGGINTITPYPSVGNGSSETYNYSLIVAPQTVPANNVIANIIINDADKFQFSQSTDLILQSSKQYTYTFTVDIATKKSSIEFNGSINNWEDVTSDGSEEYKSVLTLADFSEGYCPTSSDSWIITDETATTEDFEGLKNILSSISSSGRKISLSFPNLKEFPRSALSGRSATSMNALISVSADEANIIGESAFDNCPNLTSVSLPKTTTIGSDICAHCTNLKTISLPNATNIGISPFYNCTNLRTISLPKIDLTTWDWDWIRFSNKVSEITLKDITYSAENGVIYNKNKSILYRYIEVDGVTEFTAPESVTEINDYAFYGCTNLTNVSLPQVATIGKCAFSSCSALSSVSLPQANSIGKWAFVLCSALSSISLPQATNIVEYAFHNCPVLTTISLPKVESSAWEWNFISRSNKVSEIILMDKTYSVDNGAIYNKDKSILYKYVEMDGVTKFTAPESVTEIMYNAFYSCSILTSVSLPQATNIGYNAFGYCSTLVSASLPQATTIESNAFKYCTALTNISLPQATTIENHAFAYCPSLTSISLPHASTIGSVAFYECSALTSVSLPQATTIEYEAFKDCTDLKNLEIATESKLIYINDYAFENVTTENIDLVIGSNNEGIDINNKTWNGRTFKSITLK